MFHSVKADHLEDYFLPQSKRQRDTVYFCRVVGYDESCLEALSHYYFDSRTCGIYLRNSILNPLESEINYFYQIVGESFVLETAFIEQKLRIWIPRLNPYQLKQLSCAIYHQLIQLQQTGKNQNVLKNVFIKFMCWIRYRFEQLVVQIQPQQIPKILYEGEMKKHLLYFFQLLATTGCDIILVYFEGDEAYREVDPISEYAKPLSYPRLGQPQKHFVKINWQQLQQEKEQRRQLEQFSQMIQTNQWLREDALVAVLKDNLSRSSNIQRIYNLFFEYRGAQNRDTYSNELYTLKKNLQNRSKTVLILQGQLENPSVEEVSNIKSSATSIEMLKRDMVANLNQYSDTVLNMLVQRALIEAHFWKEETSIAKLKNQAIRMVCWLNRYGTKLFANYRVEQIPVLLYLGSYREIEGRFFELLAQLPVDILLFCPNLEDFSMELQNLKRVKFEQSLVLKTFPEKEQRVQVSTAAYQAERELDTILYQDSGLFRSHQFVKSVPVTLRTTYEEIGILWKEEAKYRPSFEADQERVKVPVIFAEVLGVKNGDISNYWQTISSQITEETIFISKVPHRVGTDENPIKSHVTSFFRNGKLQVETIKRHSAYQYEYLNEQTQHYILDKIQELIELKWIRLEGQGVEYAIVSTLLNLDRQTIRLIQGFDFTKVIPKVIMINTKESVCSLEDCIYLAFLNLIGFDIIIYVPTGYRTVGKYLPQQILEQHQIGEYLFDLNVPNLKGFGKSVGSIFGKWFRGGKN